MHFKRRRRTPELRAAGSPGAVDVNTHEWVNFQTKLTHFAVAHTCGWKKKRESEGFRALRHKS